MSRRNRNLETVPSVILGDQALDTLRKVNLDYNARLTSDAKRAFERILLEGARKSVDVEASRRSAIEREALEEYITINKLYEHINEIKEHQLRIAELEARLELHGLYGSGEQKSWSHDSPSRKFVLKRLEEAEQTNVDLQKLCALIWSAKTTRDALTVLQSVLGNGVINIQ